MKKIFKKWYFWVILFFLVIIISAGSGEDSSINSETQVVPVQTETAKQVEGSTNATDVEATTTATAPKASEKTAPQPEPTKPAEQLAQPAGYKVVSVVDGDTVKVSINGVTETTRIIGINTPETVDPRKEVECFGKEASNKAKEMLSRKTVTLEIDSSQGERDKYGRLLRYVFLADGTDFGKFMIASGYAYEYTYSTPYKYQSAYKSAQAIAETNKLGLWSPNTCNGNTTSTTPTNPPPATTPSSGKYYTSSHYSAKYYYPESCDGWKGLSPTYLKSFNSLEALLSSYPSRSMSPGC